MYDLKPVFDLDAKVDIPDCMYRLPVIQSSKHIESVGGFGSGDSPTPCALAALAARQDNIIARLEQLKEQVNAYQKSLGLPTTSASPSELPSKTADLVVKCPPSRPPHSLPLLLNLLSAAGVPVHTSQHTHSSCGGGLPDHLSTFLKPTEVPRSKASLRLTVIWCEEGSGDCQLLVSPLTQLPIRGEVNLLRYIARLYPNVLSYEGPSCTTQDEFLDNVHRLYWGGARSRAATFHQLTSNLSATKNLAGVKPGASDLALFSAVVNLKLQGDLSSEAKNWFDSFGKAGAGSWKTPSKEKSKVSITEGEKRKKTQDKSPVKEKVKKPKEEKKAEGKPNKPLPVNPVNSLSGHLDKSGLFNYFSKHGIGYSNVDHPEVFTVEAMMPYLKNVDGAICKNLFLKDKKKKLFLLSAAHDREVKLNEVAKKIGAKELRFGDESVMKEVLGVSQGCVSAFALANDTEKQVTFIVDQALMDGTHGRVNFHPMVNTATTAVSVADFVKFLSITGHTPLKF